MQWNNFTADQQLYTQIKVSYSHEKKIFDSRKTQKLPAMLQKHRLADANYKEKSLVAVNVQWRNLQQWNLSAFISEN